MANNGSPPIPAAEHPDRMHWYNKLNHGWSLEACSSIFSLGTISPNAFIAVLSTASRASLVLPVTESISQLKWLHLAGKSESKLLDLQVFDNASRGPLGAAKFFYSIRSASFVPYIACFITLAALLFDPFSQQLLAFDEIDTQQQGLSSSAQLSHVYDFQNAGVTGAGNIVGDLRDIPMRTAIINGLFGQIQPPPFLCPGSKCDFPPFTSLGVYSECNDVSQQVTVTETQESSTVTRGWIFTLPGNVSLLAQSSYDAHRGFVHTLVNSTTSQKQTDDMPISISIVRFPSLGASDGPEKNEWLKMLQAYRCSVYLCGQSYANWTMANGTLNRGTQQTSKLKRVDEQSENGPLINFGLLDQNFSDTPTLSIHMLDMENVGVLLSEIFNLKSNSDQGGSENNYEVSLSNSPDPAAIVHNITMSMSNRMLSGPNSTTVYGNVYASQAYVFVQWGWITLPVTVELVALGLLIAVSYMTRRAGHLIWKSSLTPLLLTDDSYPLTDAEDKPFWTTT
ncbi:hypothetical protein GGR52DRAFT_585378 [Hypoxylon sp. FL1284]|nr:hypothetical protein GGR52DRAFT_585378 [Hypoxylon sp. FL1284]